MELVPLRAAIVDNTPFYRRILSTCLRSLGWDYGIFETGYGLIEHFMAGGESFDLAFIDSSLPLLSAAETAASLRLFIPEQQIVFMGLDKKTELTEANRYIEKPIDFALLVRYLQSIADRRMRGEWNRPTEMPVLVAAPRS